MSSHRLLCLAYSRKHGGRCVAGLRVDGGGWVRPVSTKTDGTLTHIMCELEDGRPPELLDVIEVGMLQPLPLPYQPENWLIDRTTWKLVERPAGESCYGVLWNHIVSGPELFGGTADKEPEGIRPHSSLTLVRTRELEWIVVGGENRRTRVRFAISGCTYELGLTDDYIERKLRHLTPGTYAIEACGVFRRGQEVLLTVSLGEPFHGFCYKLVAAVIGLE